MKNKIKKLLIFILLVFVLVGCQPRTKVPTETEVLSTATVPAPTPTAVAESEPWWQERVFYEIFVHSFYDSDGDGVGDFEGIIEKLDYLNDGDPSTTGDLGITGIWLMPINPSPSYHGYDVTDYYTVNPEYGTMDDFKALLAAAEERGIAVIMDLVINHTSTEHPWFQASIDPESDYHDWYVWSETDPNTPGPWYQDVWHRNGSNGMYYYGVFWGGMPDLNYDNPDVSAEMMNISKFWLEEVGVDGFRVDAARYLFADGAVQQDTAATIQWFEDWRDYYKAIDPDAFTVGEVWTDLQVTARYGDGMDTLFMFDLAEDIKNSLYSANPERIIASYLSTLEYFPTINFSTFLSNHDQERVMSLLNENEDKAKLTAFVYLTGPGTPFIYYGEEIGMTGNKPDELLRTPMQWTGEAKTGFTTGVAWQPANANYTSINVAAQDDDELSLLNLYRTLVQMRNKHPVLQTGEYLPFSTSCRLLYPILRVDEEEAIILLANLGRQAQEGCTLSMEESSLSGDYALEVLMGSGEFAPISFGTNGAVDAYALPDTIEPWEHFILKLNP